MPKILSIDPGQRTGVAFVSYEDDTIPELLWSGEVYGGLTGFKSWWGYSTLPTQYDILLCEDFKHREGVHGVDHEPDRVIGWLQQWEPIMQQPGGRKRAVPDQALKRLGLYLPGEPNRNAREAVRHAVMYIKNQGHKPTIRRGFVNADW